MPTENSTKGTKSQSSTEKRKVDCLQEDTVHKLEAYKKLKDEYCAS